MKQIPILSGKALLIEMPEGAKHKRIEVRHLGCFLVTTSTRGELMAKLPPGNWRIIGMLSEVTESESSVLVKSLPNPWDHQKRSHRNYQVESKYAGGAYLFDSALESLDSAIKAEGYVFSNPCGEKPIYTIFNYGASPQAFTRYEREYEEWSIAQERVLCRERCLLLWRKDA